jgi:hypothetical protein
VISQTNIGWEQWFRGSISIRWGELYNHDIQNPPFPLFQPSAARWVKKMLVRMWKFELQAWQIGNEI